MDTLVGKLGGGGCAVAHTAMLEFCGNVLQLEMPECDAGRFRQVVDSVLGATDAIVSATDIVVPHLFVSDMDSTMIGQECIDELADFAGLKEKVSAITERAMQGELDFEAALRERVGLLEGLEETAIKRCLDDRIQPSPGARVLVETLKAKGCHTVLVTGGFHHFADPVARLLGFEQVVGNRLAVKDGKLTGGLAGPVVDSAVKKATLHQERERLGEEARTMAAGDGANDIPMIEEADFGMAYRAKPAARSAANGWIDRGDLTSILELLDIPQKDWVEG